MRGNADNGKTVIQALEKLGGVNTRDLSGNNPRGLYFFKDSDKVILCVGDTDYSAPDIIRNFKEIDPDFQYCVYYRGNSERSTEVIKSLIRLGGINPDNLSGGRSSALYYIDKDNCISEILSPLSRSYTTDLYYCLVNFGVELYLPEIKERKLIPIRGNNYDEEEVFNRIKELKPV